MKKTPFFISTSIIVLSFVSAFYFYKFYPNFPDLIATHWSAHGVADGFSDKISLFLIPFLALFCYSLFFIIPKIDPLKENIKKFQRAYEDFIMVFNLFMFYLFSLIVIWNLDVYFNMIIAIMPAFAILFYSAGELVLKSKRNYTIGIRTPWALEDDKVWEKTNRLGSAIFKLVALACLISIMFPAQAFVIFFAPLIVGIIYVFIYSYLEFLETKKIAKK